MTGDVDPDGVGDLQWELEQSLEPEQGWEYSFPDFDYYYNLNDGNQYQQSYSWTECSHYREKTTWDSFEPTEWEMFEQEEYGRL